MAWHKQGESYLRVCEGSVSKREMIGKSCSRLAGREQFGGPDQLQVTRLVSTLGVRADDAERKNKKQ